MGNQLLKEATTILQKYPYEIKDIEVIQGEGERKALWKVNTQKGEIALKRSHYPLEKLLFSVYGHIYVLERGARVPQVILSKEKLPYVKTGNTVYTAYQWFPNSRNPDFNVKDDLKETVKALALFHQASKGYVPPVSCKEKWRMGKGIKTYQDLYKEITDMQENIKGLKDERRTLLLNYIPRTQKLIEDAVRQLEILEYDKVLYMARKQRYLTHEDFGEPNALMVGNKGYVIDVDGMAYNLPTRELQKMIIKGFRKHGMNGGLLKEIVSWYEGENPLSSEQKKIMLIEMSIPSHLFRFIRAMLYKGEDVSVRELAKVIEHENQKESVLQNIRLK
jgi:CotS family spore coat protein